MAVIAEDSADPVYVFGRGELVELRIGFPAQGMTRYALLSPKDARMVAVALITEAEKEAPPVE